MVSKIEQKLTKNGFRIVLQNKLFRIEINLNSCLFCFPTQLKFYLSTFDIDSPELIDLFERNYSRPIRELSEQSEIA